VDLFRSLLCVPTQPKPKVFAYFTEEFIKMEYITPIVAIEAIGNWSFTKFVQSGNQSIFYKLFGYVCYIGVVEFFQIAIFKKGLVWANTAWDGWSNIATGLVGLIIFQEKPTLQQLFGMILVSIGLFFLGSERTADYL
jgi:multidrug transporter EmrE-like cation transporter